MNRTHRSCLLFLILFLSLGIGAAVPVRAAWGGEKEAVILFTHDTHSHFLPAPREGGGEYGGYVRLATLLKQQRAAAAGAVLTVDGGDFSMGTLFQVLYETEAAELRTLGLMGYDVATLGNHEFDYRAGGFAAMLKTAARHEPLPVLVQANYRPPAKETSRYDDTAQAVWDAMEDYGVTEYTMIERDGVRFAVFGINGIQSHEYAPMSGMLLEDPIAAAQRVVSEIQANETYDYLICLSHSGTSSDPQSSEDELLAKAVPAIDVIVSGHTHTVLFSPKMVGGTVIVSAGAYTEYLGVLKLSKLDGRTVVDGYELIPVDETVPFDPEIAAATERFKGIVGATYLSDYRLEYDQVVAESPFDFTPIGAFADTQTDDALGSLIADSYLYAVKQAEGDDYIPVDLAVVPAGVVRASFSRGPITVADAFNVSSLGYGADGTPGYPLISVYLTGRELMDAFEVDASVTPLMSEAQLYTAGMTYTFNPYRMFFNKVTGAVQVLSNGAEVPLEPNKLYRVVTGLYSGQMLSAVKGKSFGILSIVPKDEDGNPVVDWERQIIHTATGAEVKEWYALTSYLQALEVIPEEYSAPLGRKTIEPSLNPIELLKHPNAVTLTVLGVALLLIFVIILTVVLIRRRRKKRRYGRHR